ncbi:MAG: hypothetical protein A2Z35_06190 [Actinobacteria bacterium RBG_19FT_COMBO_36_27]|nr:MAG: hypothetical protein A2Z35_06190 [Actinobacteria bacterium RBG_19FT_COMBO_36_27]
MVVFQVLEPSTNLLRRTFEMHSGHFKSAVGNCIKTYKYSSRKSRIFIGLFNIKEWRNKL